MPILESVASNSLAAVALALVALAADRWVQHPAIRHALWLMVLLRLIAPPLVPLPLFESSTPTSPGFLTLLEPTGLTSESTSTTPSPPPVSPLGFLWCLGLSTTLLVMGIRGRHLQRLLSRSWAAPPSRVRTIHSIATRLGLRTSPRALVVEATVSPMLLAIFGRTWLILPARLLDRLEPKEFDTLVAHELAHLKRRDPWIRHLEALVQLLFWWHPVSWWASTRLRRAEEQCCDVLVRRILPHHQRAYANCLLKTLDHLVGAPRSVPALASGIGTDHPMKGRLMKILSDPIPQRLSPKICVLLGALGLAALAFTPTFAQQPNEWVYEGEPIAVDLEEAPVLETLSGLAKVSGLNFVVEPGTDLSARVSLQNRSMPWDQTIDHVLREADLTYRLEGNILWIRNADGSQGVHGFAGKPISVQLQEADLEEVFVAFGQWADLEVALDEGISGEVTAQLMGVPWDQALDAILRLNDLESSVSDGVLRIHKKPSSL